MHSVYTAHAPQSSPAPVNPDPQGGRMKRRRAASGATKYRQCVWTQVKKYCFICDAFFKGEAARASVPYEPCPFHGVVRCTKHGCSFQVQRSSKRISGTHRAQTRRCRYQSLETKFYGRTHPRAAATPSSFPSYCRQTRFDDPKQPRPEAPERRTLPRRKRKRKPEPRCRRSRLPKQSGDPGRW